MSVAITARRATLDDLMREDGKAELVNGKSIRFAPTGFRPALIAGRTLRRLADYAETSGRGVALGGTVGFAVPELPSGRESFSPDAAFYSGPLPADAMRFVPGAPDFAVEVRGANDFGPGAEREYAAKRADYFAAGTLVVWDVDPLAGIVRRYTADGVVAEFAAGTEADAEPALPGWRLAVDWLMA